MSAPAVSPLPDSAAARQLRTKHVLFFVYAGEKDGPLWEAYSQLADRFRAHHYFYSCSVEVLQKVTTAWEVASGNGRVEL